MDTYIVVKTNQFYQEGAQVQLDPKEPWVEKWIASGDVELLGAAEDAPTEDAPEKKTSKK